MGRTRTRTGKMPVPLLPPDTTLRARGWLKIRFANVMPRFFLCDAAVQPFIDLFVRAAITQARTQIMLHHAEKTRAHFPIGRQADASAMAADWFALGRDNSNLSATIGKTPAGGRGGGGGRGHG